MGKVVRFLLMPGLLALAAAGCAFPDTRWVKPGADEQATASDLVTCRHAAEQESYNSPTFISPGWAGRYWSRAEANRFYDESRLTRFCMQNKGYELVAVPPPQTGAPAPAPATTNK
jgi:hypothetical protein